MSAHTQGPLRLTADAGDWRATHDGLGVSEYRAIVDASGKVAALVVDHDRENADALDTKSNGLLFVAAPRLLKALRMAVRQNEHDMLMTDEELRACRAAIARATGAAS